MQYNRAFIIRNCKSIPLLNAVNLHEDCEYWLFESGESFHGEHDGEFFYFRDQRIDKRLTLPLECVRLEYSPEEELDRVGLWRDCVSIR